MAVRCLIVDDNHAFLRAARELLEHQGISVVGVASTGDQAYLASREHKPDVVLVDIGLHEESGFDVARRLASQAGPPPVILISADASGDFEDMIADSPAVSFLAKADLSATAIRSILARTSTLACQGPAERDSR